MGIFDNYKEQNAELKRLKKERKLLRKSQVPLETRQTRTIGLIVFSLLMLFAFTINPILSLLDNLDSTEIDNIDKLTNDYIDELTKPVNVDNLIKHGKIPDTANDSLYNTLKSYGIDIFNADHSISASKANDFSKVLVNPIKLTDHEVGALVNGLINATDANIVIDNNNTGVSIKTVEIIELSIYKNNEDTYIYSVLSLPLNELLNQKDLPQIYICTNSKISVEDSELKIDDSSTQINEIDSKKNSDIVAIIDAILQTADLTIHSLNTDIVWSILNDFSTSLHSTILLEDTKIVFTPIEY